MTTEEARKEFQDALRRHGFRRVTDLGGWLAQHPEVQPSPASIASELGLSEQARDFVAPVGTGSGTFRAALYTLAIKDLREHGELLVSDGLRYFETATQEAKWLRSPGLEANPMISLEPDRSRTTRERQRRGIAASASAAANRTQDGETTLELVERTRLDEEPPPDVDAFMRALRSPLEDPLSGRRFRVVSTGPGRVTYRRFNGSKLDTVSTATLQAIVGEVLEQARAAKDAWPESAGDAMFTVSIDPQIWKDHNHFATAVIAGVAKTVFDWFDGLTPETSEPPSDDTELESASPRLEASPLATVVEHGGSTRIGVPYADADELATVTEHDPFATDPDVIERGTRSHARLQNQLAREVVSMGYRPLSPSAIDPLFDLAWWEGADLHVAEVKSTTSTNEEHQLRLGLGQLLRYRHVLTANETTVHATLYVEHEPADLHWVELCRSLEIALRWHKP